MVIPRSIINYHSLFTKEKELMKFFNHAINEIRDPLNDGHSNAKDLPSSSHLLWLLMITLLYNFSFNWSSYSLYSLMDLTSMIWSIINFRGWTALHLTFKTRWWCLWFYMCRNCLKYIWIIHHHAVAWWEICWPICCRFWFSENNVINIRFNRYRYVI